MNYSDGVINKNAVSDQIVAYIEERIIKGELKSGDKLPSERVFAETLGVSRIPLREALRSLSQLGLVETKHGQGTFIRDANNSFLTGKLATYMYSSDTSVFEILQFRQILESECAKLAATLATEEELEEIKYYRIKAEDAEASIRNGDYDEFSSMDIKFHTAIVKASHNQLFLNLFNAIHKTLRIQQIWSLSESHEIYDYIDFHRQITEAIENRDPEQAYNCSRDHIISVGNLMMKSYKKDQE
ncbi:FadR/GntR family transcriptional regulator [Ruminiclostridium cellobioparum]|uniref:Transcriptional regulator n=1 Tax=Ruminiclostridium cellobioparum subsp. termitidis CT1112 TaxID=1195236 RepID=S0FPD8_RUMCE|nr:FadR/GntR family transcriptional regulator [Ruminiclostridium cellobioparum]EMS72226.1 transcriptional regulator [Ruminiclostridium cellobioparum subsp. termitidis CT1112]